MAKPGPKPKGKVEIRWSPNFAYAIGLLVTDGNLSADGRHIIFTSKDAELISLFQESLKFEAKVIKKSNGISNEKKYFVTQFSDVLFYRFLCSIGILPNKSKTIGEVSLPAKYFFDFLRGCFDGDGCTYSYFDPRWKSSFMFYTVFVSASEKHIHWLQKEISERLHIQGHISSDGRKSTKQLKYAKSDSLKLLRRMYYAKKVPCLSRKRLKVEKMLGIVGQSLQHAQVEKLVNSLP